MKTTACGLLLACAAFATVAQERTLPSLPGFPGGMMIDPRQMAPMRMPSKEEAKELERQSAEMSRLNEEIQRLQRLGRLDEAEALGRKLDELMSSGPMGVFMEQQRSATRDLLRQLGPAMGIDLPEEALEDAGKLSIGATLGMSRRATETMESFLPEPLFVRPVPLLMVSGFGKEMMRQPKPARDLVNEAYFRAAAKDWAGAEAALAQASTLAPSPLLVEARGRVAMMRGDHAAALRYFQSALESVEKSSGPRSPLAAQLLWEQAAAHGELAAPRRALELSERALAMLEPASFDHAAGLNNVGVALHRNGDAGGAIKAYESSLAALRGLASAGSRGSGVMASMLQSSVPQVAANLGLAQWQSGDPATALATFRMALDERAAFENANDPFLTERAALAKSQALSVELHSMMTLERIAADGGASIGLQTLLQRKGAVLERQARALTGFRRDAEGAQETPALGGVFESTGARFERERGNKTRAENQDVLREYEAAAAERSALASRPAGSPTEEAAQRKKIAALDARMQVMQREMQMQEETKRQAAGRQADRSLDRRELASIARSSGNDPQKMMAAINAASARDEQAREQSLRAVRRSLSARVQERVPDGAVLLEMVKYRPLDPRAGLPEEKRWGPARYGTYVLRPKGPPVYVDLGEAEPLDKLVQAFRRALANPEGATGRELGRKLDEALMRPVRAHLGDARTIYVAPEGSLNLAPLAALVDEQGRYLLERYTFSYLASGRDLLVLQRGDPARSPPLVIADPAFSLSGAPAQADSGPERSRDLPQQRSRDFHNASFERLPGTALEAQTLKRILPDAVVLTGTAATETAAKRSGGPRILHIATHGFFLEDGAADTEDPMLRSGLVFAGVNALGSAEDDGVLTALEAAGLDLRGTRLVVLSACETGLGEVKNGEGVFGLRRAFVVAGAETLLMSLWQVADEATKDLMVAYYTRLARGEPRAEALRQAQLAMLGDPKTSRPFFWAAFISSGEAGVLK